MTATGVLLSRPRSSNIALARAATLITACALAAGCAALPEKPPAPAPAIASLAQMLEAADKSRADGHVQKARDGWRAAAASYPSEHTPWVRLAQSHFEVADYGNAIAAAEEALQRNPHDQTALGIMAVGGLRVSSRALSNLNEKQALGDSRSHAESIVQMLRSVLGESSLLANPTPAALDKTAPSSTQSPTQATTLTPERVSSKSPKQGQTAPTLPSVPSSTAKRPPASGSPLDLLR